MRPKRELLTRLLGTFVAFAGMFMLLVDVPCRGQGPPEQADKELIVLLKPSPPAPTPQAVAEAINGGLPVPGALGEGNPTTAEVLGNPAAGRLLEFVLENPNSAEARAQRYILLRFPSQVNLGALATALSHNPFVEGVETNSELHFHVSGATFAQRAAPSDPLLGVGSSLPEDAQWGAHLLKLPGAWDFATGHGIIGLLDLGLMVNHEDLKVFGTDQSSGQLRLGPFREHLSDDLDYLGCGVDEMEEGDTTVGHGTHVTGIAAGSANNSRGVAGACWDCAVAMIRLDASSGSKVLRAFSQTLTYGAQAISMSFGLAALPCAPSDARFFCTAIQLGANRDALLVASAGNDLEGVEFPANDADVIGVGGLEWIGVDPVEQTPIAQAWSEEPNCPLPPGIVPKPECGSNSGPELDLVAPAKTVLSTLYVDSDYRLDLGCADSLHPFDGYGPCTGTSMSAPFVAGVGMLARAVNPLLDRDDVFDILVSTSSNAGNHTNELGFGYPDAEAAVRTALGEAQGLPIPNRLTPLFSFFGTTGDPDPIGNPGFERDDDWAYTTVPTTASGFLMPLDTVIGEAPDPYRTEVPSGLPRLVASYDRFPGMQAVRSPATPCRAHPSMS